MKYPALMFLVAAACGTTNIAQAQIMLSRSATLNHGWLYGAGGDSHTGSDSRTLITPLMNGDDNMNFGGATSGVLPNGQPYSGGVDTNLHYNYNVLGTPFEIQAINADAMSHIGTAASGAGVAVTHASNPGNEIILNFRVNASIDFHLNGSIELPAASPFSHVSLQRFNGIVWESLFYSFTAIPNGTGPFNANGTLTPGLYRMWSVMYADAQNGQVVDTHYHYDLQLDGLGGCLADFNHDEVLDFFDYLDFVDAFAGNSPQADFNQDGVIDFFDYLDFVDQFSQGCG